MVKVFAAFILFYFMVEIGFVVFKLEQVEDTNHVGLVANKHCP